MKSIKEFAIFCDGGFGNRYNALVSGLTIANYFGWNYKIYWPQNNWCQAGFEKIFDVSLTAIDQKLTDLAPALKSFHALLHDELGAKTIERPFHNAYDFSDLDAFGRANEQHEFVFFYPALIPHWLTQNLLDETIRALKINEAIQNQARRFLIDDLNSSAYYGIHLRRTDLNIGYSDQEVQEICNLHPDRLFFVCSDDPYAEILAQRMPNVKTRRKNAYVEKKISSTNWTAPTADDDGRVYHGNIQRSENSVVDAVVDMLILGHAEQLGMTGSTFKTVSKMICQASPLLPLSTLSPIQYPALADLIRLTAVAANHFTEKVKWVDYLEQSNRTSGAIQLMRHALAGLKGRDLGLASAKLGELLLKSGAVHESLLYMHAASALIPNEPVIHANIKVLEAHV